MNIVIHHSNVIALTLTRVAEKCHTDVEASIKLLAKKEGTEWTYKNIIKGALLPMIINNKLPDMYRAFGLLGNEVFSILHYFNSGDVILSKALA